MALFVTACPHCQQDITLDDQWNGLEVECPLCNGVITVSIPESSQENSAGSHRMKLRIKEDESPTVSPAVAGDTVVKDVVKDKLGTRERVAKSTKADISRDVRTVIIIAVVIAVLALPVYLVCKFSNALGSNDKSSTPAAAGSESRDSAGNTPTAARAAGKFIPAHIAGKPGTNRTQMLKDRTEAIGKFEDNAVSWQEKMRILKQLIERYPELSRDAELMDWKERIEEKL